MEEASPPTQVVRSLFRPPVSISPRWDVLDFTYNPLGGSNVDITYQTQRTTTPRLVTRRGVVVLWVAYYGCHDGVLEAFLRPYAHLPKANQPFDLWFPIFGNHSVNISPVVQTRPFITVFAICCSFLVKVPKSFHSWVLCCHGVGQPGGKRRDRIDPAGSATRIWTPTAAWTTRSSLV